MLTSIKRLALAGLLVVPFAACDSVVETEPRQSVSSEVALTSLSGVRAVLNEVYDTLQDETYYGQEFVLYPDALADNIDVTPENSNRYPGVVRNDIRTQLNRYDGHYEAINLTNNIIAAIDELDVGEDIRQQIKGEAYFLRGLNYFDLVRTKAYEPGRFVDGFNLGVILRTDPTLEPDDADYRTRNTVEEVYGQIVSDLEQAADLLSPATTSDEKYRANEAAALALLGRVHLYAGDWEAAVTASTEALQTTNAVFVDAAAYVAAFTDVTNPESLFELKFEEANDGDVTGFNESLNSLTLPSNFNNDGISRWGSVIPSANLLGTFEEGDLRLGLYTEASKGQETYTYTLKWVDDVGAHTVNIPVIRYSEVLLNRAEAYAHLSQAEQALQDLNQIRERAGLEPLNGLQGEALIDAILQERRLELAFEGFRFFDLKRLGRDIPKPQVESVLPYTDYKVLAPLPTGEIDQNPELVQNPGY